MGRNIEYLDSQHSFGPDFESLPHYKHGSGVAAQVVGNQLGICPSCTLVVTTTQYPSGKMENWGLFPKEHVVSQLIDALDDIKRKGRQGKASINMSFHYIENIKTEIFYIMFREYAIFLTGPTPDSVLIVTSCSRAPTPKA